MKDSAQFSAVLNAKARAEATRDSLYQQIAIIKSIDDSRYLWSHLMYEISNALPQYTWLREVTQTSQPRSVAVADTVKLAASSDTANKTPRQRALERDRAKKARGDSLLAAAKETADAEASEARRSQVRTVDRSERIRTYNYPENRISDHRTGYKSYNLDQVLNGELQPVIDSCVDADLVARLDALDS